MIWARFAGGVGLLILLTLGVAVAIEDSEVPDFSPGAPGLQADPSTHPLGPELHLAGSGSNLIVTRALAAEYRLHRPEARLVVHDSIGSTGAVRAVLDGVIELGLIARALRPDESREALRVTPYARIPIALVAHPDVRATSLSEAELLSSLALDGRADVWPDGQPRVWLLREQGDAGTEALAEQLPAFGSAHQRALDAGAFRVLFHDDDMTRALLSVPGSLGISDVPAIRSHMPTARMLALDGVEASAANVRAGLYPHVKRLAFITRRDVNDVRIEEFIRFATGPEGLRVVESLGGLAP